LFLSVSLAAASFSHYKTDKKKLFNLSSFDHTYFLYLAAPFFSASVFKGSSCHPTYHFRCQLLKPLLLTIRLFDAVTISEYHKWQHSIC